MPKHPGLVLCYDFLGHVAWGLLMVGALLVSGKGKLW